jgi:xanthine dehydrogenase accessory factor
MVSTGDVAALVTVHRVQGSAPRETDARMAVRADGSLSGTIGGGALEWDALREARRLIAAGRGPAATIERILGPDLGQCCGGRVSLLIETFDRRDLPELDVFADRERRGAFEVLCRQGSDGRIHRTIAPGPSAVSEPDAWCEHHGMAHTPVLLFGAGHVGRALVLALVPLPFDITWIDSREGAFPTHIPANATPILAPNPVSELSRAAPDAFVLIMTHEHALDLVITAAALQGPFPFVGLIGSDTKRARFERRFRDLGIPKERIEALHCPIGLPTIHGKQPAIIAASVAAQILAESERLTAAAAQHHSTRAGGSS